MVDEPEYKKLRAQLDESGQEIRAILESAGTAQSDLAKSYINAKCVDDLIELVAEPLCLATATMFFALESPGPINLVAVMHKRIAPTRYYKKIARSNAIFSECLLWVLDRFNAFCKDSGTFISEKDLDLMAVKATIFWYCTNRLPKIECKMLREELIHAIKSRARNPPKGDKDQMVRVMNAYGQKPDFRILGKFSRAAIADDPISFLEPLFFAEKYRSLTIVDS